VNPIGGGHIPQAHLHVIPRFQDEVYAGRGIRWWFKQAENTRGLSQRTKS
jgi:diadenosine tetraphosphate (Ap4A) HIT family hydrolase